MAEENDVTANKLTEENQVTKEPQRVQQVTRKNPKKVEVGKRLAESNRKRREEQRKEQAKLEKSRVNQYYRIGAVIALEVIGDLGYYIYQTKEVEQPPQQNKPHSQTQPQTNKVEMD